MTNGDEDGQGQEREESGNGRRRMLHGPIAQWSDFIIEINSLLAGVHFNTTFSQVSITFVDLELYFDPDSTRLTEVQH